MCVCVCVCVRVLTVNDTSREVSGTVSVWCDCFTAGHQFVCEAAGPHQVRDSTTKKQFLVW